MCLSCTIWWFHRTEWEREVCLASSLPVHTPPPSFKASKAGRSSSPQPLAISRQQVGNRLCLCTSFQLQGYVPTFPRTSSLHTRITVKFNDSKLMPFSYLSPCNVTSLHGVSIHLEQFPSFPQISKTTQLTLLLHWIYPDSWCIDSLY